MAQEEAAIPANGESNDSASKSAKNKPIKLLPTDRLIFSKHLDLLRAYAVGSNYGARPVRTTEVANISKITVTTIYVVNPFFVDIGLIEKSEGGFLVSPDVINYARAYEWNPDTASRKLAPTISKTWFAEELLPKISYGKMAESDAIADLAQKASAGPGYRTQIKYLIDYMVVAGLIQREGDFLRKAAETRSPSAPVERHAPVVTVEQQHHEERESAQREQQLARTAVTTTFSQPAQGVVQFHVSVKVDMGEFAGWSPDRISAFFGGIAQVLAAKGALEKDAGTG